MIIVCVGVGVGVWVCHGVSARLLGVTRRAVTVIVHDCIQVLNSPAAAAPTVLNLPPGTWKAARLVCS